MAHSKIEFIYNTWPKDMDPVRGPTIVFVKVMRADAPPVPVAARPTRCAKSNVIRREPLSFPVDSVIVRWLHIKTTNVTMFGDVNALLENVIVSGPCGGPSTRNIWQWEKVEQGSPARVPTGLRDYIAVEVWQSRRMRNVCQGNQSRL